MSSAANLRFLGNQELGCQGRRIKVMRKDSIVYKKLVSHLKSWVEIEQIRGGGKACQTDIVA